MKRKEKAAYFATEVAEIIEENGFLVYMHKHPTVVGRVFNGNLLVCYNRDLIVVKVKYAVNMRASLKVGRAALKDALASDKLPRNYLVVVRSYEKAVVLASAECEHLANWLCDILECSKLLYQLKDNELIEV